jgi:hypothetical protein
MEVRALLYHRGYSRAVIGATSQSVIDAGKLTAFPRSITLDHHAAGPQIPPLQNAKRKNI